MPMMLSFSWTLAVLGALCWESHAWAEKDRDQWFVELSMKGQKSNENGGVRSIVWGRISAEKLLVNLKEQVFTPEILAALKGDGPSGTKEPKSKVKPVQPITMTQPNPIKLSDITPPAKPPRPLSPSAHLTASFGGEDLERCVHGAKLRDFVFLVESLSEQVHKINIDSRKDYDSCGEKLRDALRHLKIDITLQTRPTLEHERKPPSVVRILVEFRSQKVKESLAAETLLTSELDGISSQKKAEEPQVPRPQGEDDLRPKLLLNGQLLSPDADGWFVMDVDARQDCDVELWVGGKKQVAVKGLPYFIRPQVPVSTEHPDFTAVILKEGAASDTVSLKKIDTEDEVWRFKKISIPIYLEMGLGYTLLDPVPSEDLRDRPTAAGQITTQPLFGDLFATFEGHLSTKPGSRIPWTLLAQGFVSRNFDSPLPQLSFPLGLGARLFKAKVTPQEDLTDLPIVIPESVLGPAVKLGVRMKWSRTFSQILVSVTPLKVGSSPLLIDYNPWVSFGYRWTSATAFIVTSAVHQVRYPTSHGTVQLGVSSLLLGLQHDLE
jgi:hypothetical protein